jgi:hypothetical protein
MRGGGWVGEAAGEWRRRACEGAFAPAQIPASGGEVRVNKRLWKLLWVLGAGEWPTHRRAHTIWRPRAQVPFELPGFEISKVVKVELHSKTYNKDYCRVINPLHSRS